MMITRGDRYGQGSHMTSLLLIGPCSSVGSHSTDFLSRGFSQEPIPPGREFLVAASQAQPLFETLYLEIRYCHRLLATLSTRSST
jgi:hypothetical protein